MQARLVEGSKIANSILTRLQLDVQSCIDRFGVRLVPQLVVLTVSDRSDSDSFLLQKTKMVQRIGFKLRVERLQAGCSLDELVERIDSLNRDQEVHGIQIHLPMPQKLRSHSQAIFDSIAPYKDVEGLSSAVYLRMKSYDASIDICDAGVFPCNFKSTAKVLQEYRVQCSEKKAVVLGNSYTAGQTIAEALRAFGASVTTIDSKTKQPSLAIAEAHILASATGKIDVFDVGLVREGAVVLDFGINSTADNKVRGDLDTSRLLERASLVTPVPGGMGPLTSAMVLHNLYNLWKDQIVASNAAHR